MRLVQHRLLDRQQHGIESPPDVPRREVRQLIQRIVRHDCNFAAVTYPGVQLNVRVPDAAPSGDTVLIVLNVGSVASRNPATVAIR